MTKEKIDLDIVRVQEQIAELKKRYVDQRDALAADFKEKMGILQTRERDLKQKRKAADDMEKKKMTQNLSVEELRRLLAMHDAENRQIVRQDVTTADEKADQTTDEIPYEGMIKEAKNHETIY